VSASAAVVSTGCRRRRAASASWIRRGHAPAAPEPGELHPFGGQGAFITTAGFQNAAAEVALEPGFPRIGLINGRQLVDPLVEHWTDVPPEFRERLGLKPGLVRI
jgi:hypothetical protein